MEELFMEGFRKIANEDSLFSLAFLYAESEPEDAKKLLEEIVTGKFSEHRNLLESLDEEKIEVIKRGIRYCIEQKKREKGGISSPTPSPDIEKLYSVAIRYLKEGDPNERRRAGSIIGMLFAEALVYAVHKEGSKEPLPKKVNLSLRSAVLGKLALDKRLSKIWRATRDILASKDIFAKLGFWDALSQSLGYLFAALIYGPSSVLAYGAGAIICSEPISRLISMVIPTEVIKAFVEALRQSKFRSLRLFAARNAAYFAHSREAENCMLETLRSETDPELCYSILMGLASAGKHPEVFVGGILEAKAGEFTERLIRYAIAYGESKAKEICERLIREGNREVALAACEVLARLGAKAEDISKLISEKLGEKVWEDKKAISILAFTGDRKALEEIRKSEPALYVSALIYQFLRKRLSKELPKEKQKEELRRILEELVKVKSFVPLLEDLLAALDRELMDAVFEWAKENLKKISGENGSSIVMALASRLGGKAKNLLTQIVSGDYDNEVQEAAYIALGLAKVQERGKATPTQAPHLILP